MVNTKDNVKDNTIIKKSKRKKVEAENDIDIDIDDTELENIILSKKFKPRTRNIRKVGVESEKKKQLTQQNNKLLNKDKNIDNVIKKFINDQLWVIKKQIGHGGEGSTWLIEVSKKEYVMKINTNRIKEIVFLNWLEKIKNTPQIYAFFIREGNELVESPINMKIDDKKTSIIVMEKLGKSVQDVLENDVVFDIRDIVYLGRKIQTILKEIHAKEVLHLDIKPGNIVFDPHDENNVYLIDFGLAEKSSVPSKKICGTLKYMSMDVMQRKEHSYHQDYENLFWTLYSMIKDNDNQFKINVHKDVERRERIEKWLDLKSTINKEIVLGRFNIDGQYEGGSRCVWEFFKLLRLISKGRIEMSLETLSENVDSLFEKMLKYYEIDEETYNFSFLSK